MSVVYRGPWDLEAPTNVVILERALSELPQPHPETEVLRASFNAKLRICYQELCHAREGKSTLHFYIRRQSESQNFVLPTTMQHA